MPRCNYGTIPLLHWACTRTVCTLLYLLCISGHDAIRHFPSPIFGYRTLCRAAQPLYGVHVDYPGRLPISHMSPPLPTYLHLVNDSKSLSLLFVTGEEPVLASILCI